MQFKTNLTEVQYVYIKCVKYTKIQRVYNIFCLQVPGKH